MERQEQHVCGDRDSFLACLGRKFEVGGIFLAAGDNWGVGVEGRRWVHAENLAWTTPIEGYIFLRTAASVPCWHLDERKQGECRSSPSHLRKNRIGETGEGCRRFKRSVEF